MDAKSPAVRGFPSAPERTRTSTDHKVHKALNLARLPIPPQALGAASIASALARGRRRSSLLRAKSGGLGWCWACVCCVRPGCALHSRTHVRYSGKIQCKPSKERTDGPDQTSAGNLRLHQAIFREGRLSADNPRYRQGGGAGLVLDGT